MWLINIYKIQSMLLIVDLKAFISWFYIFIAYTILYFYISGSQCVVPGPVASEAPGNFLEMQIIGSPRPILLETLGMRTKQYLFKQGDLDAH